MTRATEGSAVITPSPLSRIGSPLLHTLILTTGDLATDVAVDLAQQNLNVEAALTVARRAGGGARWRVHHANIDRAGHSGTDRSSHSSARVIALQPFAHRLDHLDATRARHIPLRPDHLALMDYPGRLKNTTVTRVPPVE